MINKDSINRKLVEQYAVFRKLDKKQMVQNLMRFYACDYAVTLSRALSTSMGEERQEYEAALAYLDRLVNIERVDFDEFLSQNAKFTQLDIPGQTPGEQK